MALFQKRPQMGETASLYSIGLKKDLLIVGLGNVGEQYSGTRHNIGFECVDIFANKNDFPDWINKKDLKSLIAMGTIGDSRVILAKPTTFMNLSGEAVQAIIHFYKIPTSQVIAVHDELDIDFGQVRTRVGGADAGHNGIKSIITSIGDNFGRLRIGIGPKKPEQIDSADFVLQKFNAKENEQQPALSKEVSAILSEWVYGSGQDLPHETRSFLI